jgi:hypothetical protein
MASAKITIDTLGMTAIVCRRSSYQRANTVRKFKADCGSVVAFTVSPAGAIVDVDQYHDQCRRNCTACEERTRLAKLLIESGK